MKNLILEQIVVGEMEANCYVFGDPNTKDCVVIDPGDDYEKIMGFVKSNSLKIKCIINTHGHVDHIGANKRFDAPCAIHNKDAEFLQDPAKNLSLFSGPKQALSPAEIILEDGDVIEVGGLFLGVIHTPGHTPGGICLKYMEEFIFTGDTLFKGGIGRTDFSYGSREDLLESIRNKLLVLPDIMVIYPGHGPSSTIGEEKRNNIFIRPMY